MFSSWCFPFHLRRRARRSPGGAAIIAPGSTKRGRPPAAPRSGVALLVLLEQGCGLRDGEGHLGLALRAAPVVAPAQPRAVRQAHLRQRAGLRVGPGVARHAPLEIAAVLTTQIAQAEVDQQGLVDDANGVPVDLARPGVALGAEQKHLVAGEYFDIADGGPGAKSPGLRRPLHYRLMFMVRGDWLGLPTPSGYDSVIDSFGVLEQAVQLGIESGELKGGDVQVYTSFLWSIVHGLVSLHLATPYFPTEILEELYRQHQKLIGRSLSS